MKSIRVGVDLAKLVFQVHGVNREEKPVLRRRLARDTWIDELIEQVEPGCVIGWSHVPVHIIGRACCNPVVLR